MKGRMDVLNVNNQRSSKSSSFKDVIKIETDDELEKENCETEIFIETRNKEMEVDLESSGVALSDTEDTEMEYEDDDRVVSELPVLSVIIKEEHDDEISLPKKRPDVEIKYEDDIEEEEYDSDDSVNFREMPLLSSRPGVESPSSVRMRQEISYKNQNGNFDASFLNSSYIDASLLAIDDKSSLAGRMFVNDSRGNISLNGAVVGRGNDSVLLSIVYATINVPFSQVSKFLTAYNLSKSQLSVIRKVRRQVKNRLYAQNCRRRRIAHIKNLADELRQMRTEKEKMCSLRAELVAKKEAIEKRYCDLHDYIMNTLKQRCRSKNVDFTYDSNEEELEDLFNDLNDEREVLEESKKKLETDYGSLYTHVFKVISERNSGNYLTKNNEENPFNAQLRSMNIADELVMLNKYYAKNNNNNKASSRESGDLESSVSMDGSRTSENKLNDFIDYESSVSVDGSRTEENSRYDFVEYESSINDDLSDRVNGAEAPDTKTLPTAVIANNIREIEDIRLVDESSNSSQMGEQEKEQITMLESSELDDGEEEEENLPMMEELSCHQDNLERKKERLMNQYGKLYDHILKATGMNETEFLKNFMDYCITLLLNMPRET